MHFVTRSTCFVTRLLPVVTRRYSTSTYVVTHTVPFVFRYVFTRRYSSLTPFYTPKRDGILPVAVDTHVDVLRQKNYEIKTKIAALTKPANPLTTPLLLLSQLYFMPL